MSGIMNVGGGQNPTGTIISFMGTIVPDGYLACDGAIYNIADYQTLADFFEVQFGSKNKFGGDGTTTFAVPDLQGEFLRGSGTNSHTNCGNGDTVGVHQEPTRIMTIFNDGRIHAPQYNKDNMAINRDATETLRLSANYSAHEGNNANDYYRYSVRPTNTSVLYCIKY